MSITRLLTAVVLLALISGCSGLQRDQVKPVRIADCPRQTDAELLAKQKQLGPLSDTHTLNCALTILRSSQNPSLRSSALGSRISLYLAEREDDPERREKLATEGVGFAETALAQGGNSDGAVHYYLAANLGLAIREHPTQALGSLDRLENEMKQAMALNPDLDDGGPLRLLGSLYLKAPAWPNGIGDLDKSLELLKKAATQHPQNPLNHLFYAEALCAEGGDASLSELQTEFALGVKLLNEGNWGYSKASWQKEFDAVKQTCGEIGPSR